MKKVICPKCLKLNEKGEALCFDCKSDLLLNNEFYLLKVLGENSGKTYLSQRLNNSNEEYFVIKELSIKKMKKWKEEELFQRERIALSNLNNEFIPDFVCKFDIKEGKRLNYYTVIKYIDGDNKKNKNYSEEKILNYILKLADILDYIHSTTPPVIHRDLKLSNIIIKGDDIYLIDFGSVTNIVKEEGGSTIAGTFAYMAPEQFLGKAYPSTDYYALGILATVMLTGLEPEEFLEYNHIINWKILKISDKFKKIISELLIYDYKKRIKSKKELIDIINLPTKEEKYDIVSLMKFYAEIKKEYRKITTWKWKVFPIFGIVVSILIYFIEKSPILIIMSFPILFYFYDLFRVAKIKQFSSKFFKNKSYNKTRELDIIIFEAFIKNHASKDIKTYYYRFYDEFISAEINLSLLLKYRKDFKEDEFLDEYIREYEIYEYGKYKS